MMYKLIYKGTFSIPEADDACVITLTDMAETRALSIVLAKEMASEIKRHEHKAEETRNHLVDVFAQVMKDEEITHYRIEFEGIQDRGFKAKLVNTITGKGYELLPETAVLLSLTSGFEMCAPLEGLQKFSTRFNKEVMSVALPIMSLPDSLLQKALDKAVEEENYEGASFIRDEMKRREEKNKK